MDSDNPEEVFRGLRFPDWYIGNDVEHNNSFGVFSGAPGSVSASVAPVFCVPRVESPPRNLGGFPLAAEVTMEDPEADTLSVGVSAEDLENLFGEGDEGIEENLVQSEIERGVVGVGRTRPTYDDLVWAKERERVARGRESAVSMDPAAFLDPQRFSFEWGEPPAGEVRAPIVSVAVLPQVQTETPFGDTAVGADREWVEPRAPPVAGQGPGSPGNQKVVISPIRAPVVEPEPSGVNEREDPPMWQGPFPRIIVGPVTDEVLFSTP